MHGSYSQQQRGTVLGPAPVPTGRPLLRIPKVSNTAPNGKMTLTQRVDTYGGKFRQGRRFEDPRLASSSGALYDTEGKGPKCSLSKAIQASGVRYRAAFKSKTKRFGSASAPTDLVYNSDTGRNATMVDAVLKSGVRYSQMRSPVPRFRPATAPETSHLGPGYIVADKIGPRTANTFIGNAPRFARDKGAGGPPMYSVDAGTKTSLASQVAKSPRVYSSLRSQTERFRRADTDPHLLHALQRIQYSVDAGDKMTMATATAKSPLTYSHVFEATYPRFLPPGHGADRHLKETVQKLDYTVDAGTKTSLSRSVAQSPIVYSALKSTSARFREAPGTKSAAEDLGPGSHDTSRAEEYLKPRITNIVRPSTQRFSDKQDTTKNLGSTYQPGWDEKKWRERGFARVTTTRPPLHATNTVDQMYDIDHGVKTSLASGVKRSTAKGSLTRSGERASHQAMIQGDPRACGTKPDPDQLALGPGRYSPRIVQNSQSAVVRVKDPHRPTSSVASSAARFVGRDRDKHLSKAMETLDYQPERFGTIEESVRTTGRLYAGVSKATGRKDLNDL